jgi:hypothetical protein
MALLRMQCRGGVYARDTRATTAIEAAAVKVRQRFDPHHVELDGAVSHVGEVCS